MLTLLTRHVVKLNEGEVLAGAAALADKIQNKGGGDAMSHDGAIIGDVGLGGIETCGA